MWECGDVGNVDMCECGECRYVGMWGRWKYGNVEDVGMYGCGAQVRHCLAHHHSYFIALT